MVDQNGAEPMPGKLVETLALTCFLSLRRGLEFGYD